MTSGRGKFWDDDFSEGGYEGKMFIQECNIDFRKEKFLRCWLQEGDVVGAAGGWPADAPPVEGSWHWHCWGQFVCLCKSDELLMRNQGCDFWSAIHRTTWSSFLTMWSSRPWLPAPLAGSLSSSSRPATRGCSSGCRSVYWITYFGHSHI